MKHRYIIQKDGDAEAFSIKEYAEVDKGIFSFICEEKYDPKIFQGVLAKGKKSILALLRTNNFFPPSQFAEHIAQSIETLMSSSEQASIELLCDDAEFLSSKDKAAKKSGEIDVDATPLDDFIEEDDDIESDFDESVNTRDGVASIKIDTNTNDVADSDDTP